MTTPLPGISSLEAYHKISFRYTSTVTAYAVGKFFITGASGLGGIIEELPSSTNTYTMTLITHCVAQVLVYGKVKSANGAVAVGDKLCIYTPDFAYLRKWTGTATSFSAIMGIALGAVGSGSTGRISVYLGKTA